MPFPWTACNYYCLTVHFLLFFSSATNLRGSKVLLISCKHVIKVMVATCSSDCCFYWTVFAQDKPGGSCFSAGVLCYFLGTGKNSTTSLMLLTQQKPVLHYKLRWPIATKFPFHRTPANSPNSKLPCKHPPILALLLFIALGVLLPPWFINNKLDREVDLNNAYAMWAHLEVIFPCVV